MPSAAGSGVPSSALASGAFLFAQSTRVEFLLRSSTEFTATKQPLVWEMDYNSPTYPLTVPIRACKGGSGQKEQLQCLNLLEKQVFGGADSASTR